MSVMPISQKHNHLFDDIFRDWFYMFLENYRISATTNARPGIALVQNQFVEDLY